MPQGDKVREHVSTCHATWQGQTKKERELSARIDNRYGAGIYEYPGSHVRAEHKSEKHRAIFLC